jgi:undecaprenyl-diphosphatase
LLKVAQPVETIVGRRVLSAMKKQLEKGAAALLAVDERAYQSLEPYRGTWPVRLISGVGSMGDQAPLRTVAGVVGFAGLLSGNRRLLRAGIRMILAHELATALKNVVKHRVDRHRPKKAKRREDRKLKKGKRTKKALTSFPSGHSAGSIAVAQAFAREFPEYRAPAVGMAMTIAAAQVPRCSHYVTDVVAGLTVGAVAEAIVNGLWNGVSQKSQDECA